MDKNQLIGLAAATAAFIVIGGTSLVFHKALDSSDLFSFDLGYDSDNYLDDWGDDLPEEEYIATVYVEGDILRDNYSGYYDDYSYDEYDHYGTLDYVDTLTESETNKGILLYIDSAGGGVYESDELYLKLMEYKEKTGRPVWAYLASEACSGGYYVAMASDRIYCNRNGLTGSIGVVMTIQDYSAYMKELGISEVHITSGANKTMGNGTEQMTEEQESIFQSLVDETFEQFVDVVSVGRKMTVESVKALADGRVYSPKQALELGLIDEISSFETAEEAFKEELGIEDMVDGEEYALKHSSQRTAARGSHGSGRLMFYAKPGY